MLRIIACVVGHHIIAADCGYCSRPPLTISRVHHTNSSAPLVVIFRLSSINKNNTKKMRRLAPPAPTPIVCLETPAYSISNPFLDLDANPPNIDGQIDQNYDSIQDSILGWNGNEYGAFQKIPMYNGGKNNDNPPQVAIGTSYTGYDCSTNKLCVAAHLTYPYYNDNDCTIDRSSASSWVSINGGSNKYFVPDSDTPLVSHYVAVSDPSYPGGRLIGKQTKQSQ